MVPVGQMVVFKKKNEIWLSAISSSKMVVTGFYAPGW